MFTILLSPLSKLTSIKTPSIQTFAARYASSNIQFYHLFPGVVNTNAVKSMPWYIRIPSSLLIPLFAAKVEDYAESPVYVATSEEFSVSGTLLKEMKLEEVKVAEAFNDPAHGERLWTYSVQRASLE